MRFKLIPIFVTIASIALVIVIGSEMVSGNLAKSQELADKIYTNGKIYTVEEQQPWVEAVAIDEGKFLAVGSAAEIEQYKGSETEVIDLQGKFVMPGMIDTHIHPDSEADNRTNVNFLVTSDWATAKETLLKFSEQNPDRQWLFGGTLNWLQDGGEPIVDMGVPSHKSVLDEIIADRPVALYDQGYHAMLVNSKALELVGIDRNTPDPEGGIIVKDENGEPTGVLRETAVNLILAALDLDRGENWIGNGIEPFFDELSAFGITGMTDAYASRPSLDAYRSIEAAGNLNFRLQATIASPLDQESDEKKQEFSQLLADAKSYDSDLIDAGGIKYIMDGSAAGQTAVMLEPFLGTDFRGEYRDPIEEVKADILVRDRQNVFAKVHAIGDRAVREVLDGLEVARQQHPDGPRHSIAHGTFVDPDDIPRFAELNVIYEASPALWFPNPGQEVLAADVGEEKVQTVWPIKAAVESGAKVTYGSDWPVSFTPNPWIALETMITRQKPGGSEETLGGQSAIDLETAIKIFTVNGAYHLYKEDEIGSIAPGKSADMIVLEQNLFDISPTQIGETEVWQTVFQGNVVHQAEG